MLPTIARGTETTCDTQTSPAAGLPSRRIRADSARLGRSRCALHCSHVNVSWLTATVATCWQWRHLTFVDFLCVSVYGAPEVVGGFSCTFFGGAPWRLVS
jgi:hypothetical protein